jgi:hypothetical protein
MLLNVLKCAFVDVNESYIDDVERPLKRIFNILGLQKND